MGYGTSTRELTEREKLEADARMARGQMAHLIGEAVRVARERDAAAERLDKAEAALRALDEYERAEMARAVA